jgi:hypothetical protein
MRLNCVYSQRRERDEVTLRATLLHGRAGLRLLARACTDVSDSFCWPDHFVRTHLHSMSVLSLLMKQSFDMGLGNALHQHVGLGGTSATLMSLYKTCVRLAVIPDTRVCEDDHEGWRGSSPVKLGVDDGGRSQSGERPGPRFESRGARRAVPQEAARTPMYG